MIFESVADRERADHAVAARPELVNMARANRSFLGRVVRWCLQRGVDRFLDLGSGVPTVGNVHEVAHALDPSARVGYVDFEPVAVTHATDIINQTSKSDTRADARDPAAVLAAPTVTGLLRLRPAGRAAGGGAAVLRRRRHRRDPRTLPDRRPRPAGGETEVAS